jgi:hypothetical protein
MNYITSFYTFSIGGLEGGCGWDPNTTKLLLDRVPSTMTFLSTTYSFEGERAIWKGPNWECLLNSLLNYKVYFQSIICICNRVAFSHLFATVTVSILIKTLSRIG